MQGLHQQLKLSHCLLGAGSSSAACIPPAQQHMNTQHGMRPAHVPESSAPVPAGVVVNKGTGSVHPNNCMTSTAQPLTAPLQGLCFSLPSSTTSDSDTSSSGGSSSQNGTSSSSQDSRQGNPSARMQAPGSAELLCDSPGLSSDSMSMDSPAHSPAGHHHPASKRHCQGKHTHADDRAASGMQTPQLDFSCKQSFTLPSLHSMLGSGAAASKPQAPGAAAAHTQQGNAVDSAPAARISSMLFGSGGAQHNAGMQDNSAHHPNSLQEPTAIPHASPSSGFVPTHAPQAVSTATNQRSDAAGAAAAGSALVAVRSGELDAVQAFLRACASPGVVTALAVLAQNSLMPVLPVLPVSEEDGPTYIPLCATLAHMFVLAARGAVLERLNDTTMRTLLWMTESFFSQYRSSCRICAFDYLCYDLGQRSHTMELDDPFVLDTLAEEVPTMVKLQRHILLASEWSLLVTEQQLQFACSILEAAGSSSCSIDSIQAEVDNFAQKGRGHSCGVVQADTEDKQAQQQQQQQQQQVPHRLQLFPGEVIMGMLVADTGLLDATAAAEAAAEDAAMVDEQMLDDLVVVQLPRQQQQQQQKVRKPLQAISCASTLQSVDPFSPSIRVLQSHPNQQQGNPQVQKQEQQEKQQKPHTRLQHRLAQRNGAPGTENAPSAGQMAAAAGATAARQVPAADSRRVKDQLLQLASREQAVGSKRRRTTAAAAAAVGAGPVAGAQEHVQEQQQGGLGAFGAGGKRMFLKVMRTARSAAHFLGCRPQ